MIVKFVKYLIDKDVLDKQYEEDSIYGLTIMLEKIIMAQLSRQKSEIFIMN